MRKFIKLSIAALGLTVAVVGSANAGFSTIPGPTYEKSGSPTFMIGIAVEFGDNANKADVGITAKVLSSNKPNEFVVGGGVSFFPWAKDQVGLDVGAGYNFNNAGALASYDFMRWKPQLSVGYVPTNTDLYCGASGTLTGDTCYYPAISDSRLKREIQLVDTLDNGMKIYSFKYLWSDQTYVGVMAQDLLKDQRWAHAVVTQENGFYAVNYKELNLRMTTLENWQKQGRLAIALNGTDGYPLKKAG